MAKTRRNRGRWALVTGAGKRLGRAIALGLADAGFGVVAHARESRREAEAVARAIGRRGGKAVTAFADLSAPAECERLVEEAWDASGGLDVLVNNAAVFGRTDPRRPDAAAFDEHMGVNARAVYLLTGLVGRRMAAAGGGSIVNLACASAAAPWTGFLAYSASKAAVVNLTRGYAKALAPTVRVNAVAPGPVLPAPGADAAWNRRAAGATWLDRWGNPDDVVGAVLYLAGAEYVTGAVIPVDGGRHLGPRQDPRAGRARGRRGRRG